MATIEPVTPEDVLESLMGTRVVVYFNSTTTEGETHRMSGFLRGFSDQWIIIQEIGEKIEPAKKLTLIGLSTIECVRQALPGIE